MTTNAPQAPETRPPRYPVAVESTEAHVRSDPSAAQDDRDTGADARKALHEKQTTKGSGCTQTAGAAATVVWKTVKSAAFGTGVVAGTLLLWGAAEIAKCMLTTSAATLETDTPAE